MKGARAAQCGYTPTTDLYGNLEIRISFLGCWVNNTVSVTLWDLPYHCSPNTPVDFFFFLILQKDSQFGISVQIRVYSGMQSVAYIRDIKCSPDRSWDVREIICEENYMEVNLAFRVTNILWSMRNPEAVPTVKVRREWLKS